MAENAYRIKSVHPRSVRPEAVSPAPRHIAFMSIPAHGHVNPGLGLVTELVRRGHRVTYATNDEFVAQVSDTGATPVLYTSQLPSSSGPEQKWPEDLPAIQGLFLDETIAVVAQLEDAYADDRPDLIVYDMAGMYAPVLARKWGVPYVQVSSSHVAFEGFEEEFGGPPSPELDAVHARYDAYLAEQGVDFTFDSLFAPPRCIVAIPRSIQYRADTVADLYSFVGPMLTGRAIQGEWSAPDDRPVLLISLGSAYTDQLDFYRRCMEAFGGLDWYVVMSVGKIIDPAELGAIPSNFEVHQWIPQLRVLSQASAFLTHAGMGGTSEGLYYGVPLIAAPQAADQFMNAARIEDLGVGLQIDTASVTVDALRDALRSATSDEGMRARLKEIRREIEESGGVHRAVEIVEEYLV